MPPSIVRDSKYRHVFTEAAKTDKTYLDLRPSGKATESCGVRANEKFIALTWDSGGGGSVAVIPIEKTGRIKTDVPFISGHRGAVLDFEFNPFDDNSMMTASEDLTLKLWQIPEGGLTGHLKDPVATLEGHGKKVSFCHWNRCASHICASAAFDMTMRVWNVAEQEEAFKIETPDQVWSLKWNYNGALLALTGKDKFLRIVDPRASKFVAAWKCHDGSKASKVEWIGSPSETDQNFKLLSTGFSKEAERQIALWDMRKCANDANEALTLQVLDTGTGALMPTYDPGTGCAFFPAKGDCACKYFEVVNEEPYLHFINMTQDKEPIKGWDFLPKRIMDTTTHTVMKGMKLEKASVVPWSFKVPRKSEAFQEDIFPDCPGADPAQSAEDWVAGAEIVGPKLISMAPGADNAAARKRTSVAAVVSTKDQLAQAKAELAEAQKRIEELEKENAELKAKLG